MKILLFIGTYNFRLKVKPYEELWFQYFYLLFFLYKMIRPTFFIQNSFSLDNWFLLYKRPIQQYSLPILAGSYLFVETI